MYQDFLPLVEKPARYIDSEVNVVRKDLATVATKVCLFFPDAYEVGMSHLGLKILYHILNSRADTACERVCSPWRDYEERLLASGRTLTSLESNLPARRGGQGPRRRTGRRRDESQPPPQRVRQPSRKPAQPERAGQG